VRPLRESPGRIRFLEADEEGKLLAAAAEPLRTMMLVGIYAGLRLLSEALTLRWADVDLKRGLLIVQAAYAKSGKTRTVPLNRIPVGAHSKRSASGRQRPPSTSSRAETAHPRSARSAPHSRRRAGLPS
jgi:integrase